MHIGKRIKDRRKALGVTQQELAENTGISWGGIRSNESGKVPNGENLLKIARALKCTTDWLLTGEGPIQWCDQPGTENAQEPTRLKPAEPPEDEIDDEDDEDDDEDEGDERLTPAEFWAAFNALMTDPALKGWFQIEFFKRFPELVDGIKKRVEVDRKGELERSKAVA